MNKREYNFNYDWKFCDDENIDIKAPEKFGATNYPDVRWLKSGNNGISINKYDDSNWSDVNLPHDFVIEKCDFCAEEVDNVGSLKKGKVWYRKSFKLPKSLNDKRISVRFDGIFRDSQVWCNGHFMGGHLGGYLGFSCELSEVLNYDEVNTIAVYVDATGYEGWWYEGGGIYRDVTLVATPMVKIAENGVFAKPFNFNLAENTADVALELDFDSSKFKNEKCTYKAEIIDPKGQSVYSTTDDFISEIIGVTKINITANITNVIWWDLENANMYKIKVSVTCGSETDEVCEEFGIREITFNTKEGMFLNGKSIFLKGVCGHDDFAGVGTALTRATIQFKVDKLKEMGCNAYRCSHNPPSPIFLDVCDKSGILVMDETRIPGTSEIVENDFINMIKRDRNHPSVIFYSMGNEEMNIQRNHTGTKIFTRMKTLGEKIDDSRQYLFAINTDKLLVLEFVHGDNLELPIYGVNYLTDRHRPEFKIVNDLYDHHCFVSTETTGIASIRGFVDDKETVAPLSDSASVTVWKNKDTEGLLTCYGDCAPRWGVSPERSLKEHMKCPYFLGEFLWTGFDYRGETFPYTYPQNISSFGIIDLCGFFKSWAYYMQAWWGNKPVLHILPSWNLPLNEGEKVSVWAFSNCDEVEIFINGKSQGKKALEKLGHLEWDCEYEKGELKAIGYKNGKEFMTETLVTSDKEDKFVLKTEKSDIIADKNDVTIVTVEVVDKDGNYVTDSTIEVNFEISGNGIIKGTGNGDPKSFEHDKEPKRKLFAGKAMVVVEGTFDAGEIILTAKADGISSDSVTITSSPIDSFDNYIFAVENKVNGEKGKAGTIYGDDF
ncbi:MAG: glycoside hydrolase family 2 TIM barrel-domain containing protein [Clostridia bacterium]